MKQLFTFLFMLSLAACSMLESEESASGNLQFQRWLENEAIASDFSGRKVIPVLKTDLLCEHLNCTEELSVDGKRVVFWSREELFQRGFLNEETLIVGISEQDGKLYFNR